MATQYLYIKGTSHCTEQTPTVTDMSALALRQTIYGILLNEVYPAVQISDTRERPTV